MCTVLRDDIILIFAVVVGFTAFVHTVEVRLRDGQSENQGRVEVRRHGNETWGKVCELNFDEEAAAVVCRQLHYKYSRNDKGVYFPDYPDYRLENLDCDGDERELGDCIKGEWKTNTGICNTQKDAYAGVCCSNSPDFGEIRDNLFVSHCADYWIDAEEKCEEKKATLASSDQYMSVIGKVHKVNLDEKDNKGYWTKRFYTPWMWSNGCFEFGNKSFDHQEFNLQNNTVQACLQMCSIASPPSSFLLSDNFCRCVPTESLKSYVTEVLPGWCNRKCVGDSTYFCGSTSRFYWSLYTIALERIFFKISDPGMIEHRQCAIMEASRKLSTEGCYKRYGYICGQILPENNSSLPKLMFFRHSRFYEVYMLEARQKCTSDDSTMRLIGEKILEQDIKFSQQYFHLWVDISRLLTDVYTNNLEPENWKGTTSLWRNLEPKWCLATRQRGEFFSDEVTKCNTRFRYICSINVKKDQISNSNGSSHGNDSGDTGREYGHNSSSTDVHENTTTQVYRERAHTSSSLTIIIVAVVCGLLIVAVVLVAFFMYRRSNKNGLRKLCCQQDHTYQEGNAVENAYTATFNANDTSTEHIYAEIRSENIYHEADTLLRDPEPVEKGDRDAAEEANLKAVENRDIHDSSADAQATNKEPVTIKRSYSSPKDLVNLDEGPENLDFKDPNYIYPYDKVQRSDIETKNDGVSELKSHKMGENEIIGNQSKHTVI